MEEVLELFVEALFEKRLLEECALDGLVELVLDVVTDEVCDLGGLALGELGLGRDGLGRLVGAAILVVFGLHSNQQLVE